MPQKIERTLDDYFDRSFVYCVLLTRTHSHYSRLRTLLKIPIILTSSAMSIVNSNLGGENDFALKIVNITFNLLTAIILSMSSTFKIEEKTQSFQIAERKFFKLASVIEQKIICEEEITAEFVNRIMNEYDNIVETIDYEIPRFIRNSVRNEYSHKKTLPLIINGIPKDETERSPRLSTFDGNISSPIIRPKTPSIKNITPLTKSAILFDDANTDVFTDTKNKPNVLHVKKVFMDIPLEKIEGVEDNV